MWGVGHGKLAHSPVCGHTLDHIARAKGVSTKGLFGLKRTLGKGII